MQKSYYQHKLLTASKIIFNNDLKKYSTILYKPFLLYLFQP